MTRKKLGYGLLIVLVFATLGQLFPAYFYSFQLEDHLQQEVRYALLRKKTPEEIQRSVFDMAKQFNLPVDASSVKVTREGKSFTVEVSFSVPFTLYFYRRTVEFRFAETGEAYTGDPNRTGS